MSGELALDTVAANQTSKEVTVNQIFGEVEAALTGQRTVDLTSASAELTAAQLQRCAVVIVTAGAAGHTLTLDACKRMINIANRSTLDLSVVVGTTTLTIPTLKSGFVLLDGTANGAQLIGGASGGGALATLSDVDFTTAPTNGQTVKYDSTAGKWKPSPFPSGLPTGGNTGQALVKASNTNGDVEWADVSSGGGGGGGGSGPAAGLGTGDAHSGWRILVTATEANDGAVGLSGLAMHETLGGADVAYTNAGGAFASTTEGGRSAGTAFDHSGGTWGSGSGATFPQYIGKTFTVPVKCIEVAITASGDGYWVHRCPLTFKVQFLDDTDGVTWHDAWTVTDTGGAYGGGQTRTFANPSPTHASPVTYGVPAGGTAGQVLAKIDGVNGNTHWIDAASGGSGGGGGSSAVGAHKYWMIGNIHSTDPDNQAPACATMELRATVGGAAQIPTDTNDHSQTYGSDSLPPSNLFDGNDSSLWAGKYPNTYNYFVAHYATAVSVAEIYTKARSDGYNSQNINDYDVLFSDDGVSFTFLCHVSLRDNASAGTTHTIAIPTTLAGGGGGGTGGDPDYVAIDPTTLTTYYHAGSAPVIADKPGKGLRIAGLGAAVGKALPGSWTTITAKIKQNVLYGQYGNFGLFLDDGTSQVCAIIMCQSNNSLPEVQMADQNAWSYAGRTGYGNTNGFIPEWLRIVNGSTTWIYQHSNDGENWMTVGSVAKSGHVSAPTHFGVKFDAATSGPYYQSANNDACSITVTQLAVA